MKFLTGNDSRTCAGVVMYDGNGCPCDEDMRKFTLSDYRHPSVFPTVNQTEENVRIGTHLQWCSGCSERAEKMMDALENQRRVNQNTCF